MHSDYVRGFMSKLATLDINTLKRMATTALPVAGATYGVSRLGSRLLGGKTNTEEERTRRHRLAALLAATFGGLSAAGVAKADTVPVSGVESIDKLPKDIDNPLVEGAFRTHLIRGAQEAEATGSAVPQGPELRRLRQLLDDYRS